MERPISILCDVDGTQNHLAPPPIKTAISLLMGRLNIPEVGRPLGQPSKLSGKANMIVHKIRPFTRNSEQGLKMMRQAATETERKVELAILSGRDPGLHGMTWQRLGDSGRREYFDQIYLNDTDSSSGYKEAIAAQEIQKGNSVVLIDDDLKPALMVARLQAQCQDGQVVLGLLLANISNHPWLLRRAGITLPANVERVSSFQEGAQSLVVRIHEGLI